MTSSPRPQPPPVVATAHPPTRFPTTLPIASTGPTAPKNVYDHERRRATFEVIYPLETYSFTRKADADAVPRKQDDSRGTIRGWRLSFALRTSTVADVSFEECNFHDRAGASIGQIQYLTFRNCRFLKCMMGTTQYQRVRFEDCTFELCDFANAEFSECTFKDCTFTRCTAEQLFLTKTELDPDAFLAAFEPPVYNYEKASEEIRQQMLTSWWDVRARIAAQVLSSTSEAGDSRASDRAWYLNRVAQANRRRSEAKVRWAIGRILVELNASPKNLAISLLAIDALCTLGLHATSAEFEKAPFIGSEHNIFSSPFRTLGLIFSFAFSSFSAQTEVGRLLIMITPILGIFWAGLAMPVLLRRFYR